MSGNLFLLSAITPTRTFNVYYILLDSIFVLMLLIFFIIRKNYSTLIFAVFGGILYFIVDFGYFYLLSKSRSIYYNDNLCGIKMTALVLLWMSLSYGITNFAYIWLFVKKDKDALKVAIAIVLWWMIAPLIVKNVSAGYVTTYRTTNQYHLGMLIILLIGYFTLFMVNRHVNKEKRINIIALNLIGISVQFFWEAALLINGIRPFNDSSILTLIVDSLIETNLGMPIIYGIYYLYQKEKKEKC